MKSDTEAIVVFVAPPEAVSVLRSVLRRFPPDFPAAIVILLHAGTGKERPVADNLNVDSGLLVMPGVDGTLLRRGRATLVRADERLTVGAGGVLMPAHDSETLLMSIAARYRERAIAVALTGLGARESQDFRSFQEVGGHTIALDESGFLWTDPAGPRVAPAPGDELLPADEIVNRIVALFAAAPTVL